MTPGTLLVARLLMTLVIGTADSVGHSVYWFPFTEPRFRVGHVRPGRNLSRRQRREFRGSLFILAGFLNNVRSRAAHLQ